MTHIESKLHYFAHDGMCFYVDFDGDVNEPRVQACVEELRGLAQVELQPPREVGNGGIHFWGFIFWWRRASVFLICCFWDLKIEC